ncbi:MAG TPA: hypothetical protein VG326_14640 [Tepidisphaeraceae bacterium]|jgi:hypothetical protein|nr:hypothetical protein [Tepidisphaeraceae bacterium]
MLNRLCVLLLMLVAVGCGPESRSYSVSVKNDTDGPLTLNLTKDGPPAEAAWAAPEDIADGRIKVSADSRMGFNTLQAGATQAANGVSGQFNPGVHALLRVYRGGNLQVRDMLAIKPGPNRQDLVLAPGGNSFVVRDKAGQLSIEPAFP